MLVLTGLGWHRRVISAAIFCFLALDLYTVHFVSIPYYTGLIRHKPGGALAAFHLSQFPEIPFDMILERLLMTKPSFLTPEDLFVLWGLFLLATLAPLLAPALAIPQAAPAALGALPQTDHTRAGMKLVG
jgi:hypothetical protein